LCLSGGLKMKKEIPLLETPKYQAPHMWGFLFVG
jgi:hypothetical protein